MKPSASVATGLFLQTYHVSFRLRVAVMKPYPRSSVRLTLYKVANKFGHTHLRRRSGPRRQWQHLAVPNGWFRQKSEMHILERPIAASPANYQKLVHPSPLHKTDPSPGRNTTLAYKVACWSSEIPLLIPNLICLYLSLTRRQ